MNQPMLRSDYAFHLPGELIAQHSSWTAGTIPGSSVWTAGTAPFPTGGSGSCRDCCAPGMCW